MEVGHSQPGAPGVTLQSFNGQLGLPHLGAGVWHMPTERWQPCPLQMDTLFSRQPGHPFAPCPHTLPTSWHKIAPQGGYLSCGAGACCPSEARL